MIQRINDESWNALVGKTIANAYQAKANTTDDDGFLILEFTDGTKALIESSYAYLGQSQAVDTWVQERGLTPY